VGDNLVSRAGRGFHPQAEGAFENLGRRGKLTIPDMDGSLNIATGGQ
jgi:hypothetical protein